MFVYLFILTKNKQVRKKSATPQKRSIDLLCEQKGRNSNNTKKKYLLDIYFSTNII